jgi:hypothetical protein
MLRYSGARYSILGVRDRIKKSYQILRSHNREHKTLKWVKNFESVYKLNNWFSVKLQNCGWIPCLRVRDSWPWLHALTHQVRTQWTSELFLVTEWSLPGASIHWSKGGEACLSVGQFSPALFVMYGPTPKSRPWRLSTAVFAKCARGPVQHGIHRSQL